MPPQPVTPSSPNQPDAHGLYERGLALLDLGKPEAALDDLTRALELDGAAWETHNALGNCLRYLGQGPAAEAAYLKAIALGPGRPDPWFALAFLYAAENRPTEAAHTLLELVPVFQKDLEIRHQAGGLLADLGCYSEAVDVYTGIVRDEPAARNFQRLGQYLQKLGRFEAATEALLKAIESEPTQGAAYLLLANTRRMQVNDRPLQSLVEAGLMHKGLSDDSRACMHFALGKLLDDWREYDAAFTHYQEANRLRRASGRFDRPAWRAFVESTIHTFEKLDLRDPPRPMVPGPLPLFIVGMLRSGTTLLDRMLANHAKVASLGETERVDAFAGRLAGLKHSPYPACLEQASREELTQIGEDLRRAATGDQPSARYVIDKNPMNFMHVGLLALVLPSAPIIHCRRDPLDTCLSIYFQNFAHERIGYAYDFEDIAAFYAGYEQLMDFWASLLPDRIVQLDYATVVSDAGQAMGALCATLGLEWDPKTIQPQSNPATITTASIWQARQPVYAHAVGRWRNYAEHLQPLQQALDRHRRAYL